MAHWENMANKLAEMKEVQLKQALQKEKSIEKKIEGAQKRFDENIKIQKLDLNGKDKVKSERREELFKKIRQQDRRNFQQSQLLAKEYSENLVKRQKEIEDTKTQVQLRAQMKTQLEKSNMRMRKNFIDEQILSEGKL